MHPTYEKADRLSGEVIGAGIEVHRIMGPGLLESIYEKCFVRELELHGVHQIAQKEVRIEYKDLIFTEELRFDVLIEGCLLVEIKAVQAVHPIHEAQLLSYMKLLNVPVGLVMNFHQERLVDGIKRMILRDADKQETD